MFETIEEILRQLRATERHRWFWLASGCALAMS